LRTVTYCTENEETPASTSQEPGASSEDRLYADADMDAGSEGPANPAQSLRVLTIMLALEY
jgi:hypothetical protein